MTAIRVVPSSVTATALDTFLDRHAGAPPGDTCLCGHEGHDTQYVHIYRDMLSHGIMVLPSRMFTEPARLLHGLFGALSQEELFELDKFSEIVHQLYRVYSDNANDSLPTLSPSEHMDRLDASMFTHHGESLTVDGDHMEFTCSCGGIFETDWEFEYHRFSEAVYAGAVFGKVTDLQEVSDSLAYLTNMLVRSATLPIGKVDALRTSVASLATTIREVARTQTIL